MSCRHRDSDGKSLYQPSKRGTYEVCSGCNDRFPCADLGCSHFDCRQERGQKPKCYYCGETLMVDAKGDGWTVQHKRGGDVTTHYCCRDASSSTARADLVARAKGPNGYYPEPCSHTFESKAPIDHEILKKMANG